MQESVTYFCWHLTWNNLLTWNPCLEFRMRKSRRRRRWRRRRRIRTRRRRSRERRRREKMKKQSKRWRIVHWMGMKDTLILYQNPIQNKEQHNILHTSSTLIKIQHNIEWIGLNHRLKVNKKRTKCRRKKFEL